MNQEKIEKILKVGPPRKLFPYVIDFCKSISSTSVPFYVDIDNQPICTMKECVANVRNKIKLLGGKEVLGWEIVEWYGVMIEAIFHSIWEDKDGKFHDVTPKEANYNLSLFLPDPSIVYKDCQIDNIRKSLIKDQKVMELIMTKEEEYSIKNKGERKNLYEIEVSDDEMERLKNITISRMNLISQIEKMIPGRNDPCRCGSGKKFKKCCIK